MAEEDGQQSEFGKSWWTERGRPTNSISKPPHTYRARLTLPTRDTVTVSSMPSSDTMSVVFVAP